MRMIAGGPGPGENWQICEYDVLGDAASGYEINDMWATHHWLTLPSDVSDAMALAALCGVMGGDPRELMVEEDTAVGEMNILRRSDRRPMCLLRKPVTH